MCSARMLLHLLLLTCVCVLRVECATLRLSELVAKCAVLDANVDMEARMYKRSCLLLLDKGVTVPYANYAEQLARCQNITDMPAGHLPWILDRTTMEDVKAIFTGGGAFRQNPPMGIFRFANASLGDGMGWYLIGSSMTETYGPLADLTVNSTVFLSGDPNRRYGSGARYADHIEMMTYHSGRSFLDVSATQHVNTPGFCQFDAMPDSHTWFVRSAECSRLNTSSEGVVSGGMRRGLGACANECLRLGAMCTAWSWSRAEGCVRLLADTSATRTMADACEELAGDGVVYVHYE